MQREHKGYVSVLVASCIWLALIVAAPWLAARGSSTAAGLVYAIFSGVCHQRPDRSLFLFGHQLAVCARCSGIYAGGLAGMLFYPLVRRLNNETLPWRGWIVVAALPMIIDAIGGLLGLFPNTFLSRFVTGALAGSVIAFYLLPCLLALRLKALIGSTKASHGG
jgi:uncharacterized membrane protein